MPPSVRAARPPAPDMSGSVTPPVGLSCSTALLLGKREQEVHGETSNGASDRGRKHQYALEQCTPIIRGVHFRL
jgi:hypothetical protein